LLGPDRQLLPLHNRARIATGLSILLRTTPDVASDLITALSATEWLGVIPWVKPKYPSVTLRLDPVRPLNSIPLASFEKVKLPLQVARVRHATVNQSLLEMITNAVAERYLEFKAGTGSKDQFTAVGLAWFGLDPATVPELQAFLEAGEDYNLKDARSAVLDNRYGCAVLSFQLATLLSGKPAMWKLGERDYKQELAQTVLLDHTQGLQPAIYEYEWTSSRLIPLEVRASPSDGCP
jgi:hypothetical protein